MVRKYQSKHWGSLIALVLLLSGCATPPGIDLPDGEPQSRLRDQDLRNARIRCLEETLELSSWFHMAVVHPETFRLRYPGFFIGIEKAPHELVGEPVTSGCELGDVGCYDLAAIDDQKNGEGVKIRKKIAKRLDDRKSQIVTHILAFGEGIDSSPPHYNLFDSVFIKAGIPDNVDDLREVCGREKTHTDAGTALRKRFKDVLLDTYTDGWDAITTLRERLEILVDKNSATHIVLFSTGWNTPQWESFVNYNDLMKNIELAAANNDANVRFKPIFIGLSWPSFWDNPLGDLGGDMLNKKNDADEIGLTWANLLLQEVILPVKKPRPEVKTVLIGHSFGARILSRAAYSGVLLGDDQNGQTPIPVDLLIGLQGAFSLDRYRPEGGFNNPGSYYPYRDRVTHAIFTTSTYDKAVALVADEAWILKTPYVGAGSTFKKTHESPEDGGQGLFNHAWLNPDGTFDTTQNRPDAAWLCAKSRISLVNADLVVRANQPGTGGWAHSDIYDNEIGRFIWETIKACTITE